VKCVLDTGVNAGNTVEMKTLLLIDDTRELISEWKQTLRHEYFCVAALSPKRGISRALRTKPNGVITSFKMNEMNGIEVIRKLRTGGFEGPILMTTSYGNAAVALEATRCGANDYITRPFLPDELRSRVARLIDSGKLNSDFFRESGIFTRDPAMISLLERAQLAAQSHSRVLILGETGTGKELMARMIHQTSPQADKPFVVLNCAAIHESLLESELFGHARGAFTGATENRKGRFEVANDGSLFMDEIGEIPPTIQAKLLRVLQNGEFTRVGENQVRISKARVVAATNQNLTREMEEGRFRSDLYYRLNVISLTLPPLRERKGDIPLLVNSFLEQHRKRSGLKLHFTADALEAFQSYSWPGNIRELEHVVERCCIMARTERIDVTDFPATLLNRGWESKAQLSVSPENTPPVRRAFREAREQFERDYFSTLLEEAGGNYSLAARWAKMDRTVFFRKARRALAP